MGVKGWVIAGTVGALLAAAAPAHAGTYVVRSCGDTGVNNAWTPVKTTFREDPGPFYSFDTTCDGGLQVFSKPQDGLRAPWLTGAAWQFTAPAGTRVVGVTGRRFGEVRDDREENGTDDNHWQVVLQDGAGNQVAGKFGGETCDHGAGVALCQVGAPGGTQGPAHVVATDKLSWGVVCGGEITADCGTSYGIPLASLTLYAIDVTLADDGLPAAGLDAGADGAWRAASVPVTATGSDPSGVRGLRLLVDGAEVARADQACDPTRTVPCPASATAALTPGAGVTAGAHQVAVEVTDSAQNVAQAVKTVRLDPAAPLAGRARVSGRSVSVPVSDGAGSGVASVALQTRRSASAAWTPLKTSFSRGRARARGARSLRGAAIRLVAADRAGNRAEGELAALSFRRGGRVVGGSAVGFGRATRLTARLRTLGGRAVTGRGLGVLAREHRSGAGFAGSPGVTTDGSGRFLVRLPAGVSRVLRYTVPGGDGIYPLRQDVLAGTRAASSIALADRTIRRGGTARLSGRLRLGGATVPPSGKLIDLQGFAGGKWRTFDTARARGARGSWTASYDFGGSGTFPLRVRIRREAAFPYELGYSKTIRVRVG